MEKVSKQMLKKWTGRGLNPRPNREPIRFLHAYLRFDFRVSARPKLPTDTLSSKISPMARDRRRLFPIFLHRHFKTPRKKRLFGRCLVPTPGVRIKRSYYTSDQAARAILFSPVKFFKSRVLSAHSQGALRAYVPFLLLSNPFRPFLVEKSCDRWKRTANILLMMK